MNAMAAGLRKAALRLVAAPGAVFLAVLTAGLATTSTARHTGMHVTSSVLGTRPSVVLACPRGRAVGTARASSSASATAECRRSTAAVAAAHSPTASRPAMVTSNESPREEKRADGKIASGAGASIPLPDFSTPELSRFTSPL